MKKVDWEYQEETIGNITRLTTDECVVDHVFDEHTSSVRVTARQNPTNGSFSAVKAFAPYIGMLIMSKAQEVFGLPPSFDFTSLEPTELDEMINTLHVTGQMPEMPQIVCCCDCCDGRFPFENGRYSCTICGAIDICKNCWAEKKPLPSQCNHSKDDYVWKTDYNNPWQQ